MANPSPGLLQTIRPFSLRHARAMAGGTDPLKLSMFAPLLVSDYGWIEGKFVSALDTNLWTTAVTAGGGPTAFAFSAARGGRLEGATGATDNDATAIHLANVILDPADNPFAIVKWQSNIVTGFSFEVGFSDAKANEALPGVTDVDTPAVGNGATDIGCVHLDTDQDLTTAALVGDGTTGAATKTNLTLGSSSTGYTPTAATWQTFLIAIRPNLIYCAIWDGDGFVTHQSASNGPDSGTLVRPYALFRTRNTTPKTILLRQFSVGWEQNG